MCAECKLDYDGKIVCKPCAMPLVNFFAPMIGGACAHSSSNVTRDRSEKLIERIGTTVKSRVAHANLSPEEDEIRKYILKEIAINGKSPSNGQITKELKGISLSFVEDTIDKLNKADILLTRDGRVISSYPFSLIETSHKVTFNDGHEVYALCAIDALGIPYMMGADVAIRSMCPECDNEIGIVIKNGRIASHKPDGTIVYVSSGELCGHVADTCCPFMNFFCSETHLEQWKWENPEFKDGEAYTLDDAFEYGKSIFGDLMK